MPRAYGNAGRMPALRGCQACFSFVATSTLPASAHDRYHRPAPCMNIHEDSSTKASRLPAQLPSERILMYNVPDCNGQIVVSGPPGLLCDPDLQTLLAAGAFTLAAGPALRLVLDVLRKVWRRIAGCAMGPGLPVALLAQYGEEGRSEK